MTEIAVVLKSLDDGQRFPDTDSNYRLYRSHNFTVDNFIEVLAQGRTHLLITTNQLIKIPLTC